MRKTGIFILTAIAAVALAGCGAPATNTATTNTNANAAKPAAAAAPTMDALFALDKQANEAYTKGDAKFFEGFLSDKFVMNEGGQRLGKADVVKMIATVKCDVKTWNLDEPQMAKIDNDTYVMSYRATWDGTCVGEDGKSMKIPSPVRAASVFVRSGDKWVGAYHGENLIIDPKAPPPAPAKAAEPKKDDAKKDDKATANSNAAPAAPAAPAKSANSDALVKLHHSGWEAWRTKDAKKLEEMTTKDMSFLDPIGGWLSGNANVVKAWMDMKCEGITKTSFDGLATALSPTVEILTGKGTADGTCDGQKNGPLNTTAVYVKEGDAWKLAFMFETPAA